MPQISDVQLSPAGVRPVENSRRAIIILAVLYFMIGLITCLNDTLVPFFKKGFTLTYSQSSLVQVYFFLTYGLISIPAGRVVMKIGYQKGVFIGLLISAMGALLFFPASAFHQYELFLAALFILASGIVVLQVAVNPYIVILGPVETASSRLAFIQAVGSVGTTVAPILGANLVLSRMNESQAPNDIVRYPYFAIAAMLLLIGFAISRLNLPKIEAGAVNIADKSTGKNIFGFSNLKFGIIAIFAYVGAEVSIGTFLTNYITDILHVDEANANMYVAFYWGGMLVGRFIGATLLNFIKPSLYLALNALMAIAMIILSVNTTGYTAVWLMIAVGFFNSVMFAVIFSLSVKGLGGRTTQASGLLSTAIVGGAVIPYLQGLIKDSSNWSLAFLVPAACYAYIVFYGASGYKNR